MTSTIERGRQDLLAWEAARPSNFYSSDTNLERVLVARLGRERAQHEAGGLALVGDLAANEVHRLGREVNLDENLPRLERWSGLGARTEDVVFHPSYHAIGRLIWQT